MSGTIGRIRVSLDFECGWGVIAGGQWRANQAAGVYRDLRPALKRFTQRLDELELPFTWAVVGAMVDDPTKRSLSHLRGRFAKEARDFLDDADETTFDGRDLLDMIMGMRTKQSFGTHTYSHLLFSDTEQGPEVIAEDLARAAKTNAALGLDCTRLVFPRNHTGHYDIVMSSGVTHVRMPPINAFDPTTPPGLLKRAISLYSRPVSSVSERVTSSGLTLHYASEFLNWGTSSGATKRYLHQRRISRALTCSAKGADVHFWLHPFNLAQTAGLMGKMDDFLGQVAQLRDRGLITIAGF